MQCPAQLYSSSGRLYQGIPERNYPFHDKTVVVTRCGRLCLHRKKVNLSTCLVDQAVGIEEVEDGIWLVSFMDYHLGDIDWEEKTLQPLPNPFGPKSYLCLRNNLLSMSPDRTKSRARRDRIVAVCIRSDLFHSRICCLATNRALPSNAL